MTLITSNRILNMESFFWMSNILARQTSAQKFSSCFAFKILARLACYTLLSSGPWFVLVATPRHISLYYIVAKIEQYFLHA